MNTSPSWVIARGSVIGRGHVANGTPCQDANAIKLLPDNPAWGVAAVSDGAGSCENSHLGSERVVETCTALFSDLLVEQGWAVGKPLPSKEEWKTLAQSTLIAVVEDLKSYSEAKEVSFHSLSATVIVVVFGPGVILLAHVGDGRAAGQRADGTWKALLTPYRGEEANVTIFLTSNIWAKEKIDASIGTEVFTEPFRAFAIMTDGCEMSTFTLTRYDEAKGNYESLNEPYAPFFDPNVSALIALHNQGRTEEEINNLWCNLLTKGTQRLADEPDDKTMILAVDKNFSNIEAAQQISSMDVEKRHNSEGFARKKFKKHGRSNKSNQKKGRAKRIKWTHRVSYLNK